MIKLPTVSGKQLVAALKRDGFVHVSTKGSHAKLRNPGRGRTAIVPLHKELARGTLASILRQADLTADQLKKLL